MPVYEYRCSKGHEYEKTEGFSAPTEQKCIQCNARARRQISRPTVIFKGSGFYSTDNRGSKGRTDSSAPSESSDSSNGHGHSHGAGGHSHDAPATETKAAASTD